MGSESLPIRRDVSLSSMSFESAVMFDSIGENFMEGWNFKSVFPFTSFLTLMTV